MQKELTVIIICLLALFADAVLLRQILNFRVNGNLLIDSFYGGAILAALILAALCLLWLIYILLRKLIDRSFD